jgi:hypothetical protein
VRRRVTSAGRKERPGPAREGMVVFAVVAVLFVVISLPVVLRGAPLADDFVNCLEPQRIGLGSTLEDSLDRLGALRRAHFAEIIITTEVCQHLPFGVAIVVPLVLTLAVALLLRGLLRDLGTPQPWPELGGALWLLQPLGAETALWPAAMHVTMGLALAIAAIRLHRAGRHGWGSLAVVGAGLSVEQVLLAIPLAVWLTAPPERRRRAVGTTVAVIALLLIAFVVWPGNDPRLQATLSERIAGALGDPGFLLRFPAVGLGFQSIPLAVLWAFPLSALILAGGGFLGSRIGPTLLEDPKVSARDPVRRTLLAGLGLIAALNVPVLLNVPHQGSHRLFAPTWLAISAIVATVGSLVHRRRLRLWGAAAGLFAAGAALSLALSVWVRLESASFVESASKQIAAEVPDDAVVALCGITRTVVQPAPRGAFAVNEFIYDWAARDALQYYTGRRAEFLLSGELWSDRPCPEPGEVDRVITFSDLLAGWRGDG